MICWFVYAFGDQCLLRGKVQLAMTINEWMIFNCS